MKSKSLALTAVFIVGCFFQPAFGQDDWDGAYTPPPAVESPKTPEEHDPENARIVSQQEFYFYDGNKLRIPLMLSRKAVVRFSSEKSAEEKKGYLKKYSPTELEAISGVYPRAEYALGYLPIVDVKTMVGTIRKLSADPALEVAPVFIVDGMEAVVDGIYLETVTPMSRNAVLAAIKNVFGGDAMIHEVTPEGGVWHVSLKRLFFLGEKNLPLHALSLANFLERSTKLFWVKRAYPKFAFLRDPVIASVAVTPVTGTVGEERMVTLSIRVFGKTADEVVIDEGGIPEFMQGKFVPLSNDKPPMASFFDVRKTFTKEARRQIGPNEWYIEHRYTLGLYAPEQEWTISGIEFPYEYKGKKMSAKVSPVTFFVRAHLDDKYQLSDIPEAYLMPTLGVPDVLPKAPEAKAEWFDPLARTIGGRGHLLLASLLVGIIGTLALFTLLALYVRERMALAEASRPKRRVWSAGELDLVLGKSEIVEDSQIAYRQLHDALSTLLSQRFPEIPMRNATFQHVKELAGGVPELFSASTGQSPDLEELFEDLERRHAPGFLDSPRELLRSNQASIGLRIRQLAEVLRKSEGGGG